MNDAVNNAAGHLPQLEAVADAFPNAMLVLNRQAMVVLANTHVNSLLGTSSDFPYVGKPACQVLPDGLREIVASMQREVLIYASDSKREFELKLPDGGVKLLDVSLSSINGNSDQADYFCLVIQDASDRQKVEELKKIDVMKSNFLAMVSHELRTPLTSIRGAMHLLSRDAACKTEPLKALVDIVQGNSERLIRLVNNLLEMVAIDNDKYSVTRSRVNTVPLVERALERYRVAAQAKFLTLDCQGENCHAVVDPERFVQLVEYLVENAIKFTPHGGRVSVELSMIPEVGLQLVVSDTGCGVPAYAREQIFQKFFQLEDAMTRCCGGAGVGLYLARHIAQEHGGRMWVDSNAVGGADFKAVFPQDQLARELADVSPGTF